jgi:hypothetical protein
MKFALPKLTRFLPLQEYAPEEPSLAGVGIQVWVDPPRAVLLEFDELNRGFRQVLEKITTIDHRPRTTDKKKQTRDRLLGWMHALTKRPQDDKFKTAIETHRQAQYAWYARLWSQSADAETHWTADELEKINDGNPQFYEWLCVSSWALIERHREDVKKGWRGPSAKLPAAAEPATPS